MRPPNNKRGRGRPNNRRSSNPNRSYDSNGPDGKIRGNASQVYEKYSQLARDSSASGDPIAAEGFWQHAEHYYRIMMSLQQNQQQNQHQQNRHQNNSDQNDGRDASGEGQDAASEQRAADPAQQDQPDLAPVQLDAQAENAAVEESDTAGLERAVKRSRPRRPRRPRDEDNQQASEPAAEGAAD